MKRLPIQAAKDVAQKYDQGQVILVTWDDTDHLMHVVSYGKTLQDCNNAAQGANLVKRALGFPEEMCHDKPARKKAKPETSQPMARQRYMTFMKGWMAGAGVKPFNKQLEGDPVYLAGYDEGKNTRRVTGQRVAREFGYQELVVKPA